MKKPVRIRLAILGALGIMIGTSILIANRKKEWPLPEILQTQTPTTDRRLILKSSSKDRLIRNHAYRIERPPAEIESQFRKELRPPDWKVSMVPANIAAGFPTKMVHYKMVLGDYERRLLVMPVVQEGKIVPGQTQVSIADVSPIPLMDRARRSYELARYRLLGR